MTRRRYRTTWNCPHCPTNITIFAHINYPPTHNCAPRMGRRYPLVVVPELASGDINKPGYVVIAENGPETVVPLKPPPEPPEAA